MIDQPTAQPAASGEKWTERLIPAGMTLYIDDGVNRYESLAVGVVYHEYFGRGDEPPTVIKSVAVAKEWAARLCACHNALAGIPDPAAALAMARAVLAEVEWQERSGSSRYCPCCHEESRHGHMKTCKLAAALAALSGREATT